MPRVSRKNLNSSYFHVMVQGINKEYIFNTDKNKYKYKKIIKDNLQEFQEDAPTILSYSLMYNHSHFIFHTKDFKKLSNFMHQINMQYSMYYNKTNNRVGYVFRDRFKVQEINSYEQLYNCLRYIHNNPVKAKICKSMADYKFSSYNEFIGKRDIITDKSIELLFGTSKDFLRTFENIHKTYLSDDFLDVKDLTLGNFTEQFLTDNNCTITNLLNNVKSLKAYVKQAKKETDCTLLDISNLLKIPQSTVGYYYRN